MKDVVYKVIMMIFLLIMGCSGNQRKFDTVLYILDINSNQTQLAEISTSENSNVFEIEYCLEGLASDTLYVNELALIGKIDTCIKRDWYSKKFEFQLLSKKDIEGYLKISVDFNYL